MKIWGNSTGGLIRSSGKSLVGVWGFKLKMGEEPEE